MRRPASPSRGTGAPLAEVLVTRLNHWGVALVLFMNFGAAALACAVPLPHGAAELTSSSQGVPGVKDDELRNRQKLFVRVPAGTRVVKQKIDVAQPTPARRAEMGDVGATGTVRRR